METLVAPHDEAVQMIDTSIVRVHQHAGRRATAILSDSDLRWLGHLAIYLVKLRASARYKEKASTQSRTDLLAAPFCHSPIVEIL